MEDNGMEGWRDGGIEGGMKGNGMEDNGMEVEG